MEDDSMRIRLGISFRGGCCVGALLVALMPRLACAALGEPESSIARDVQHLKGSIKSMVRTNYQVHEIQLPSRTVLREFAAPGGGGQSQQRGSPGGANQAGQRRQQRVGVEQLHARSAGGRAEGAA